jgi:hypothetical protein
MKANRILFIITLILILLTFIASIFSISNAAKMLGFSLFENSNNLSAIGMSIQHELFHDFMILVIVNIVFIILSLLRYKIVYPLIIIFTLYQINPLILSIKEIFQYGFIYPITQIGSILICMLFTFSCVITFFWVKTLNR